MKTFFYISALILLTACSKQEIVIDNLNGNKIAALGHAGMGFSSLYPINSAESILNALNIGADGTEIDIQLTKDNVLVAFHDEDLASTSELSGVIREYTWAELQNTSFFSTQYLTYDIVRLSDFLENLENRHEYILSFDIRTIPPKYIDLEAYTNDYIQAINLIYEEFDLYSHTYIEAQHEYFIEPLRNSNPLLNIFVYPQEFEAGFAMAISHDLHGISIHNDNITKEQVTIAHENGLYVIIWGVENSQENKDAVLKSPDFIETDDLKDLINFLND